MKYNIKMVRGFAWPYQWCEQNIGKRGDNWGVKAGELDYETDANGDIIYYTYDFTFRRKRDATMFALRWINDPSTYS